MLSVERFGQQERLTLGPYRIHCLLFHGSEWIRVAS